MGYFFGGLVCGIANFLAALVFLFPSVAIPVIFFMTVGDECKHVRKFGWGFLVGVVATYFVITSA